MTQVNSSTRAMGYACTHPLCQVAPIRPSLSGPHGAPTSPIQDDEHHTNLIGSACLGRVNAETTLVGMSFGMVHQVLCATALIDDLAMPCVGLVELVDECEEGNQRQMGRKLGGFHPKCEAYKSVSGR